MSRSLLPGDGVCNNSNGQHGVVSAWTDGNHVRIHWDDDSHTTEPMDGEEIDMEDDCRD